MTKIKPATKTTTQRKPLTLAKQTLANLTARQLHAAAGGRYNQTRITECVFEDGCIGFTDACNTEGCD